MSITAGIVAPVFNTGAPLEECLRSVVGQTQKARVVVVDDASTDLLTLEILKRWENTVDVVRHEANRGVGAAMNTGVEECRTDCVLAVGSDDILESEFIAQAVPYFAADPAIGVVSCHMQYFGTQHHLWRVAGAPNGTVDLLYEKAIPGSSVFRTSDWRADRGFAEDIPWVEDWDLWIRIIDSGVKSVVIPKPLYRYRSHGSQTTARLSPDIKNQWHAEIIRRNRGVWSKHIDVVMDDYWRQRELLRSFVRRFGRVNNTLNAAVDLVRKASSGTGATPE